VLLKLLDTSHGQSALPIDIDHLGIQDPQKSQRFALDRPDALNLDIELLDMSAIKPIARGLLLDRSDPVDACER
jgi:hypothetical protein